MFESVVIGMLTCGVWMLFSALLLVSWVVVVIFDGRVISLTRGAVGGFLFLVIAMVICRLLVGACCMIVGLSWLFMNRLRLRGRVVD